MKLTLPLPPSQNHYWRAVGRRVLISARGRSFRKSCEVAALMQKAKPVEGDIKVRATVYMQRLGCDLDNRVKPLLDALNGIAWTDDGQVSEIHVIRSLDRGNPRVEVEITAQVGLLPRAKR